MKRYSMVLMALTLAGCSHAKPTDTVDALVAHPDRLRQIEQQCAIDVAQVGAAECYVASEARHRLFLGNGPKYTPPKTRPSF